MEELRHKLEQAAYIAHHQTAMSKTTSLGCREALLNVQCNAFSTSLGLDASDCDSTTCVADFDEFKAGDWVGETKCGISISARERISGETGGSFGPFGNQAMIFDTSNPTGKDFDLGTPSSRCVSGGPGRGSGGAKDLPGANCEPLGNALIIAERNQPSNPDDNWGGGVLAFDFRQPVVLEEIGVLDIEESGSTVSLYSVEKGFEEFPLPAMGDNSVQTVVVGRNLVYRMEIKLKGSGAITSVKISQIDPSC